MHYMWKDLKKIFGETYLYYKPFYTNIANFNVCILVNI